MIPLGIYVRNLEVVKKFGHLEGCVVECGTWRGGMIGGMATLLGPHREYFLFDSFEGLPDAEEIDGDDAKGWQERTDSSAYFDNCRAEMKYAQEAMQLARAKRVHIVKGWFNETLPQFDKSKKIAILRLDGDWYASTMTCLENLYDCVVEGGVIILDDYYMWTGCSKAVHDFLSRNSLNSRVWQWDNNVCYIIKRTTS
ncbi:TylF/MycF/NovP-related O-methyltransferase [Flavisolibacter ginsenosidimutans]|nr:TylF/MycF/NovP-related O-methyltransferase [Flavisolibacter ginsenosidimutans]